MSKTVDKVQTKKVISEALELNIDTPLTGLNLALPPKSTQVSPVMKIQNYISCENSSLKQLSNLIFGFHDYSVVSLVLSFISLSLVVAWVVFSYTLSFDNLFQFIANELKLKQDNVGMLIVSVHNFTQV